MYYKMNLELNKIYIYMKKMHRLNFLSLSITSYGKESIHIRDKLDEVFVFGHTCYSLILKQKVQVLATEGKDLRSDKDGRRTV